jgi:hypothetical protein
VNSSIRAAIAAIGEDAWTAIRYPRAIWDDQLDCWNSDAEVAETGYMAFGSKKGQAVTARLIVRRVRDLNSKAAAGQDEPVGRGLRAARGSGLISPEPVSTRRPPRPPRTPSPSQEPRTSRTAGERQDARARNQLAKLLVQESSRKRATGIGRWIEAKT